MAAVGKRTWGEVQAILAENGLEILGCLDPASRSTRVSEKGAHRYRCRCGTIFGEKTSLYSILDGNTKSCGCKKTAPKIKRTNPTWGEVQAILAENGLVVLDCPNSALHAGKLSKKGAYRYRCRCGSAFGEDTALRSLIGGHTKSCGCLREESLVQKSQESNPTWGEIQTILSKYGIEVVGQFDVGSRVSRMKTKGEYCYRCKCGTTFGENTDLSSLISGHTTSCGCRGAEITTWDQVKEKLSQYGLEVVGETPSEIRKHDRGAYKYRCKCGISFGETTRLFDVLRGATRSCGCLQSGLELDLFTFVQSIAPDAVSGTREVIPPYEIDVYVPGKLGIELHGLYWHREGHGTSAREKMEMMVRALIPARLVLFEDEWLERSEAVKGFVRSILGQKIKVGARKCQVQDGGADFIEDHHIQGVGAKNQEFRCLTLDQKAVAAAAFRRRGAADSTEWELSRYCVAEAAVAGGLSRLVSDFWKRHPSATRLVTFADNRLSAGNVYQSSGFVRTGIVKPRYWYVKGRRRYHRFRFRKEVLAQKGWLLPSETEQSCMERQGYHRVWDAGKTVWSSYPP